MRVDMQHEPQPLAVRLVIYSLSFILQLHSAKVIAGVNARDLFRCQELIVLSILNEYKYD